MLAEKVFKRLGNAIKLNILNVMNIDTDENSVTREDKAIQVIYGLCCRRL